MATPAAAAEPTTTVARVVCTAVVPKGFVELSGTAGIPGPTTVRFSHLQVTRGQLPQSIDVTNPDATVAIEFPDDARFLREGLQYVVRAWPDHAKLVSYLTTDDCGRPRTTLADGTTVNTSILAPIKSRLPRVIAGAIATLVGVMLLVFLLGRIRLMLTENRRLVDEWGNPINGRRF
jgi:hypothetical protein